jgi:predicted ATPase
MIREWRISRFKSIAGTEALSLRPLTLLAGPNSSGKSSVIQSILLIAQSLASQVPDRQLVLNGELVKLGTFEDVRNQQADDLTVDFGFDVDFTRGDSSLPGRVGTPYSPIAFRPMVVDPPPMTVTANITFGPAGELGTDASARPLQADVVTASFTAAFQDQQAPLFDADDPTATQADVAIRRRSDAQVELLLSSLTEATPADTVPGLRRALRYELSLSPRVRRALRRSPAERPLQTDANDIVATRLEHFLPAAVVWKQHSVDRFVRSSIRRFSLGSQAVFEAGLEQWRTSDDAIRAAFATAVRALATAHSETPSAYVRRLRTARTEPEPVEELVARVKDIAGEPWSRAMSAVEGPFPEEQALAFDGLHALFEDVRYLGPLRDDPKPLYGMSGAVDPTDVGSKGQYTAAVLDVNAHVEVEFIAPGAARPSRARLSEAVGVWLQHFGMADALRTTDEAKLGHKLLVRPTGIRGYVDLTNVGVGVSQVLPILTMALVSKRGSTLLFEQPELHLHPAVQSLLGDFFIALAQSGRQCIVETHSEYLINRLRLRIAEAPLDSTLADLSIVHFVERPGSASTFTPVIINQFGAIPAWPRGFFDQGPDESELILRAAMTKKALLAVEAKNGRS